MKKAISLILLLCLLFCMSGCRMKVNSLIEEGKYVEALAIIQEDPQSYADVYDDVRYNVALIAFNNKEYDYAIALLQDNALEQVPDLLAQIDYALAYEAYESQDYELALKYLENNNLTDARILQAEVKYLFAEQLLEAERCAEAIPLLDNNGYKGASDLLNYAYNLQAAIEIEAFYNEILAETDETTSDVENQTATDYYIVLCDKLVEAYDIIVRDNSLNNVKELFADIFGYYPQSVDQAKADIDQFKENLNYENFYNSQFRDFNTLHYVMSTLGFYFDDVRFEQTETRGFMIIDQPKTYLQNRFISAKTCAYLLGCCKNLGATVERDNERIIVTYKNNGEDDYSQGYYYCIPNAKQSDVFSFYSQLEFNHYNARMKSNGLRVTVEFTNTYEHKLESLLINLIVFDVDGNEVKDATVLLFDVTDKVIKAEVIFEGVSRVNFPQSQYSIGYFLSAITE